MAKSFVALVERTDKWDHAKPAHEQLGFAEHVAYMGGLEASGFITMAGLMVESETILFVLVADSEDAVRERFAGDPMQQSGVARLVRVEETLFRIGAPAGTEVG